jgi:hypothetical protein
MGVNRKGFNLRAPDDNLQPIGEGKHEGLQFRAYKHSPSGDLYLQFNTSDDVDRYKQPSLFQGPPKRDAFITKVREALWNARMAPVHGMITSVAETREPLPSLKISSKNIERALSVIKNIELGELSYAGGVTIDTIRQGLKYPNMQPAKTWIEKQILKPSGNDPQIG